MRQTRPDAGRSAGRAALGLAVLGLLAAGAARPADPAPLPRPVPVDVPADIAPDPAAAAAEADLFAMPRVTEETRSALERAQAGDLAGAAGRIDDLIARHPALGLLHANRAALAMLAADPATAVRELQAAAAAGASGLAAIAADPLFAPIAADPRLAGLAAMPAGPARVPVPAPVAGGTAPVSGANTTWDPASERLRPRFAFPPTGAAVVSRRHVAAYDLLADHYKHGRAAGNLGDLYDNRDRGHSALDPAAHPQMTRVTYSDAARAADVDYGLNDVLLFDHVTLGNSSTAITGGPLWRSLPRLALTRADGTGPLRLWQNAAANQLYVYPAHKDYGAEMGDLFPANTPYLLVGHGSSGSDQPFLEAAAMILAAFRPATKSRLVEENLIVPTVQMVFRRSLRNVLSRDDYFSGAAHPAAFEGLNINLARMVSLANSIQPGDIPPQVRLRMLSEDPATEGVDYFGEGLAEQLFDTPAAIARIWRSRTGRRAMTLSAEDTHDPNDRPLSFHWHLLQGDPARVRIEPSGDGRQARITLDWHDPFRISDDNPLTASRVDIGVFADNGVHDSAPAILSVYFPPEEARVYAPGPDGAPRLASIDYAARPATYADPMLVARANWRDDYHYAADGTLTGWTRRRGGAAEEEFTAEGARILTRTPDGRPVRAEMPAYPLERTAQGTLAVGELSSGRFIDYHGAGPAPATGGVP